MQRTDLCQTSQVLETESSTPGVLVILSHWQIHISTANRSHLSTTGTGSHQKLWKKYNPIYEVLLFLLRPLEPSSPYYSSTTKKGNKSRSTCPIRKYYDTISFVRQRLRRETILIPPHFSCIHHRRTPLLVFHMNKFKVRFIQLNCSAGQIGLSMTHVTLSTTRNSWKNTQYYTIDSTPVSLGSC